MKQINIILLLLALVFPSIAIAYDFEVDGIYYNINGNEVTVTYKGTDYYSDQSYNGEVNIPESVSHGDSTYAVTTIGKYAFYECSELSGVIIPSSVKSIEFGAFYGCSGLANISFPTSVNSISAEAFEGTAWFNNQPDGLVYAGMVAYKYKGNMNPGTSIALKDGTLGVAGQAFLSCSNLTSISFPNTIKTIGTSAFLYCPNLSGTIIIPKSVIKIGEDVFSHCNITGFIVEDGNPYYDSRDNCNAIIESSSDKLISGCSNTIIPSSIKEIGSTAFRGCKDLSSIDIPQSVTKIGSSAFLECVGLTNVIIPNSVTSIDICAFSDCSNLTEITLGESIVELGEAVFQQCINLKNITCLATVPPIIYYNTFSYCYDATLYVPYTTVDTYKTTIYWKNFSNIVGIKYKIGDADGDGIVGIGDVTALIDTLLSGNIELICFELADLNCNGRIDIGDVTSIIDMLINGNN